MKSKTIEKNSRVKFLSNSYLQFRKIHIILHFTNKMSILDFYQDTCNYYNKYFNHIDVCEYCIRNLGSFSEINFQMPKSRKRHHSRSRSKSRSHSRDRSRDREDKYQKIDSYEKDRDGKRRKIDSSDSPHHRKSVR